MNNRKAFSAMVLILVIMSFGSSFSQVPCVSADPPTLFEKTVLPNDGSDSILCVKITNCGSIAAVYSATISGVAKGDYSVTPLKSPTIDPKDSTIFCVTYKSQAVGTSPASLDVTAIDGSDSIGIPLSGTVGCAVITNEVAAIPNTLLFDTTQFTINITNSGTFPWTPGTASISGPDASVFSFESIVPNPIPAKSSGKIYMTFHPTSGQEFIANISFPNGGPCEDGVISIDLIAKFILTSVKAITSEGYSLEQSYPNPSQGKVSFTYSTPKDAKLSIKLVDATGKIISTMITGRVSAGEHTVNFDASNLPSGIYIYILESGSMNISRQFVLAK